MRTIDLYDELKKIVDLIPSDIGGGSSISKTTLMGYIALQNNLKNYVEIGVYRGRSFFPMVRVMQLCGGTAYGIDPYNKADVIEYEIKEDKRSLVEEFINKTDFSQIYSEVLEFRSNSSFISSSEIFRLKSSDAIDYFKKNHIKIDMLHIDGNHDTVHVLEDLNLYLPLVNDGGFIILDDTDWDSVKTALNQAIIFKTKIIFIENDFAILQKLTSIESDEIKNFVEQKRLEIVFNLIKNISNETSPVNIQGENQFITLPKVSVLLVSYNQQAYIAEAIESILAQQGNFVMELIVADDYSTDRTLSITKSYLKYIETNPKFQIKILGSDHNIGIEKNYQRALHACTGDYFAICEGDDYWLSVNKIQTQIEFMRSHPFYSFCFHDMLIYWQEEDRFDLFEEQIKLNTREMLSTKELILNNFIGNFSVCLYNSKYVNKLPLQLFDVKFADWMFNIFYSQFGQIGHVPLEMSVYRKHLGGFWSGKSAANINANLHKMISTYNKLLNFEYDQEFRSIQQRQELVGFIEMKIDLLIIDDFFPDPISGFRWQEYLTYLTEFPSSTVATTGDGRFHHDKIIPFRQWITAFKQKFPDYADKLVTYYPEMNYQAKVIYLLFLNNAYRFIDYIEKLRAPFVFTLYPGGGFQLDDPTSDSKLKRVMSSPYFKKVIVTQQITSDYLINHNFCSPEKIEFIFGCVVPQSHFTNENFEKHYFGLDKDNLDICFVAHRYSEKGLQKGYDVFIEVAHKLNRLHPNIYFHVVGDYDETIFDVAEMKDRISFYGVQNEDWFDSFYENMDIILAPNINGIEYKGTFDGFPTASCIDAGLRNTAIFCTDELHLNNQYFEDGKEIVIVPHNADKITEMIENYYQNPQKLREIAINGREKIIKLYGYEAQLLPRVQLLRDEINSSDSTQIQVKNSLNAEIDNSESSEVIAKTSLNANRKFKSLFKKAIILFFINKDVKIIRYSGFFDEKWYLRNYQDVAEARINPYVHYLRYGAYEGRNPSPYFDSRWYLETYPDVKNAGINPLVHFIKYGRFEGRMPTKYSVNIEKQ